MPITPELRQRIEKAGQTDVLAFVDKYDELSEEEQRHFYEDLSTVKWEGLRELFKLTTTTKSEPANIQPPSLISANDSNPSLLINLSDCDEKTRKDWNDIGLKNLSEGKSACVIMGGGQGTRLGYDAPKGTYPIGALTGMTLFEIFVKRVMRLRQIVVQEGFAARVGDVKVPIAIMTSEATHDETVQFFEEHMNFGHPAADIYFFRQTMVPCFSNEGKVLMSSKCRLAKNPNGNGGIFSSMDDTGILGKLKDRGVENLHIHGIDNALTKVLDPIFMGYCIGNKADVGNKCCTKTDVNEKVGVFASYEQTGGKRVSTVVEYSELSGHVSSSKDDAGRFTFGAGNICNHFFTTKFIEQLVKDRALETCPDALHAAYKKIPYMNAEGKLVEPDSPNGVKMEMFIFDSFWFTDKVYGLEVPREEEFAPVKNAVGKDSPASARAMMTELHKKWLVDAGALIETKTKGDIEISPMISYGGEGLAEYEGETIFPNNPITK